MRPLCRSLAEVQNGGYGDAMKEAFAHQAELGMQRTADTAAPGAAVTAELCGHWDHRPPCPVAPHYSSAEWVGDDLRVRTLFVVEPDGETEVRQRIDGALARGELVGPDGVTTRWRLRWSSAGSVTAEEAGHARRLSLS